jgi:predicted helicase
MTSDQRKKLSEIKQFKQLIAYLRDEMGWPIKSDSEFDELTYEYTTTELGIDDKSAAQIQEIKRLRPLSAKQPWGVFFVKFEPKKLPVVALRRILGQVALKKRASANPADRTMWAQEDLLFISNYGEGDDRQITLAHFSVPTGGHTLPSLKVLGWDSKDTVLHLEAVARELTEQLSWPDNENDVEAWRAQWRAAFTVGHQEVIKTSERLSIRLAELARDIRDRIATALTIETKDGPLTKLMKAFQESLIHDLTPADFADMYAQTIAYGLLSSRIVDPKKNSVDDLATHMRLSPFLKELMETFLHAGGRNTGQGLDFDELGIGEVVDLLDQSNMQAVVADFGDRNPQEDPVIHFYELFLKEYDARKRMERGVFYTPKPVVSFIVKSLDETLRTEFGLNDGLADTTTWGELNQRNKSLLIPDGVDAGQDFVQILDPATGTGTFLVEVIDQIFITMVSKWRSQGHNETQIVGLWNEYVPKHLLTRLYGYELQMAPYAIAHLKIALKLYETGYSFTADGRVRVYLTNSLEPAQDSSGKFSFSMPALAQEAEAVSAIKLGHRFTLVVGNPPYSNFGQLNKTPFIMELLADYKRDLGEKKINLDDDSIKFLRLGQHLLDQSGAGALGFITNNAYFDGLTHRQMRRSIMDCMTTVRIVNLHGSVIRAESAPDGGLDKNVFDIQQGVGVSFWTKGVRTRKNPEVYLTDIWGSRDEKYLKLSNFQAVNQTLRALEPVAPHYFFADKSAGVDDYYQNWLSITEWFDVHGSGFKTDRDAVTIQWNPTEVRDVVQVFATLPVREIRDKLNLAEDGRDWKVSNAKNDVLANQDKDCITEVLYRPFDHRFTWYSGKARGFIGTPSFPTNRHLLGGANRAIICCRQFSGQKHFMAFCTNTVTEISSQPYAPLHLFPLMQKPQDENLGLLDLRTEQHNFSDKLEELFLERFGVSIDNAGPTSLFNYAYALLHSTKYREMYSDFLKIDYPRLPLTTDLQVLDTLASLGSEIMDLHLLQPKRWPSVPTSFFGQSNAVVDGAHYEQGSVYINKGFSTGFTGITENVWAFRIGAYQVCEKWLKDRKGRTLTVDDVAHYQKMVVAISETIRLMGDIDKVIEQHGGWPGAFELVPSR